MGHHVLHLPPRAASWILDQGLGLLRLLRRAQVSRTPLVRAKPFHVDHCIYQPKTSPLADAQLHRVDAPQLGFESSVAVRVQFSREERQRLDTL